MVAENESQKNSNNCHGYFFGFFFCVCVLQEYLLLNKFIILSFDGFLILLIILCLCKLSFIVCGSICFVSKLCILFLSSFRLVNSHNW